MTQQQTLSARILALVANGMPVIEAMKFVLGNVRVDQLIGDAYAALRDVPA